MTHRTSRLVVAAVLTVGSASCGAGAAGIVAGTGSSGGGSAPALDSFSVEGGKVSPGLLRLEATRPVHAGLYFDLGNGAGIQPMEDLTYVAPDDEETTLAGNEVDLPAGPSRLKWAFDSQLTARYRSDVRILVRNGNEIVTGGELVVGLGNDRPVVHSVEPMPTDPARPEESTGNVEIRLRISDSSSDPVDVEVKWRGAGDDPEAWQPATAAGVFPEGIEAVPADENGMGGVELSFFWNSFVDLAGEEDGILFRVTADDRTETSRPVVTTEPFRIDNNREPIVVLDSGSVVSNPDRRRGIPIPFRVIDDEGDPVDVVFQWRLEGEDFPGLDTDGDGTVENAEVDRILADPLLRREHRICTEYPRFARGRILPVDDVTVRLPELSSSESWIVASGVVGRKLELLRPSSIPAPAPGWSSSPLVALPLGDGQAALALDVTGGLSEVDLATGEVLRLVTPDLGPGLPSAMTLEHGTGAALVALDDAGIWRIERVELAAGTHVELFVSDGSVPAPVRGLASLGTGALVFTAGSSLLHLDYRDPLDGRLATLRQGLAVPWGVVVDPLLPHRVYVSEHDADRILAFDLETRGEEPVVVRTLDLQAAVLDEPEALALEHGGARLLAVATPPGGGRALFGLELGAAGANRSHAIGGPLPAQPTSLATGPDGLRVLCVPGSGEVWVAGGVEQRRVIVSRSERSGDVVVETPFQPAPRPGQPWRLADGFRRLLRGSPQGVARTFLWDSTDAPAGPVFLRATAQDGEVGLPAEALAPKPILGALEVEPRRVGDETITRGPFSVVAADLDGDGDLDLVSANRFGDDLTVFLQDPPGVFDSLLPVTLGGTGTTDQPFSVVAADLDGDGDLDLASANFGGNDLTVFFQDPPGSFGIAPLVVLGGQGTTRRPFQVAASDVDGDGDLDLVSANLGSDTLTVFLQEPPGNFDPSKYITVGGPTVSAGPRAVGVGDLDGDGDLDLVSANADQDDLTVFFQDPPGSFGIAPVLVLGGPGTTDSPAAVAVADLDGDGDLDLVSANSVGNDLALFFQDPPGSFANAPVTLQGVLSPFRPIAVAAADLDGDGDLDLVSANQNGDDLTAWFQEAPGSFGATPLVIGGDELTTSPSSVAAADLDGDGDVDLVSANLSTGQATADVGSDLMVFFQDSPGEFETDPVLLASSSETRTPLAVAAADLDGDGDLDLAFANRDPHRFDPEVGSDLTVLFQLSPGSFATDRFRLGNAVETDGPTALVAADLDGDDDLDLASANERGNDVTVFLQGAAGLETSPAYRLQRLGAPPMEGPRALVAADLDGDGDLDLACANEESDDLTVFLQRPGGYESHRLSDPLMVGPCALVAADLDADGDIDLVSADGGTNGLSVFLQQPGWFDLAAAYRLSSPGGPCSIAVADLDGDGDLDLVSANRTGNDLRVFLQDPPGTFASAFVLGNTATTDGPVSVAAADLDGDGYLDLVTACEGSLSLIAFLQVAPLQFRTSELLAEPAFPRMVLALDLDGDGDPDLVSANEVNEPFSRGNLTVFFGGR